MTRHPDFYLFLFGGYKIIRIFALRNFRYGISVTEFP